MPKPQNNNKLALTNKLPITKLIGKKPKIKFMNK